MSRSRDNPDYHQPLVTSAAPTRVDKNGPGAEDKLAKLPSEVLHIVFDYLFSRHQPNKAFYELDDPIAAGHKLRLGHSHDLDIIAATSKLLRSQVNDWAIHFLVKYHEITKYKGPKQTKIKNKTFNALRGRNGLLSWADKHCIFCGKNSVRCAILMNGFRCCAECDKKEWPSKITKSNAREEYDLKDVQLLPKQYSNSSLSEQMRAKFPQGMPVIRFGTYMSCNVPTTMFLREDVHWLAEQYHGDVEAHLAKRKEAKAERKRKRDEKQKQVAAKRAEEQAGGTVDDPYEIESDNSDGEA